MYIERYGNISFSSSQTNLLLLLLLQQQQQQQQQQLLLLILLLLKTNDRETLILKVKSGVQQCCNSSDNPLDSISTSLKNKAEIEYNETKQQEAQGP